MQRHTNCLAAFGGHPEVAHRRRSGLSTHLVYTLAGDENADPDCRRAARMIVAHSSGDVDGFNAVIDEVASRTADPSC